MEAAARNLGPKIKYGNYEYALPTSPYSAFAIKSEPSGQRRIAAKKLTDRIENFQFAIVYEMDYEFSEQGVLPSKPRSCKL